MSQISKRDWPGGAGYSRLYNTRHVWNEDRLPRQLGRIRLR